MRSRYEEFATTINRIVRSLIRIAEGEMERYGYKGSYAQYIAAIKNFPDGLTASQLCEACEKDKAAVSRALAEMEERNLVVRKSENESMYRALIFLTDKGLRMADIIYKRALAAVTDVGLTEEQHIIFNTYLKRIDENLQRIAREGISGKAK